MKKRKIVITGATRGLGRALAEKWINSGHLVCGCGRSPEFIQELNERAGENGFFSVLDVTDYEDVENWALEVTDKIGVPDLLVNNAAIINPVQNLWEISTEDFSQIIDTNLKGVFHSIRAFVPRMKKENSGIIVNMSSGWGRSVSEKVAPYNCTKFGIEGLSKALAKELPSNMACIPLNPGVIDTDMLRNAFGSHADSYPNAMEWSLTAANYILNLKPADSGLSLSIPQ
jgi:NAD(P)-dependent dehydrogenase (short-subunit alcohol dehydrogenase family)|tara:strand:+ start:1109 stop:1795 length:687 start_codon:yes stop_codon:yes gene_type:complete